MILSSGEDTMDKDRQIRLLIPPFFLLASVLWEAYLSGDLWQYLHTTASNGDVASLKTVLSILGVVGVATLPVGYAIGVLTMCLLRLVSFLFPHRSYEVPISETAMEKIWRRLGRSKGSNRSSAFCAAAVFDHALLQPSIHEWLFRRWTTFNICAQCAMALLLSCGLGHALHVQPTWEWGFTIAFAIGIFVWQAIASWKETRSMFDFLADLDGVIREGQKISAVPTVD
jgi:hypothetical protein